MNTDLVESLLGTIDYMICHLQGSMHSMVAVGMAVKSNMFRTREEVEEQKKRRLQKAHCNMDGIRGGGGGGGRGLPQLHLPR